MKGWSTNPSITNMQAKIPNTIIKKCFVLMFALFSLFVLLPFSF